MVFSKTFEGHIDHIRQVLRSLCVHGVKLKQKKQTFEARSQVPGSDCFSKGIQARYIKYSGNQGFENYQA